MAVISVNTPHGGSLVNLFAGQERAAELLREAASLPSIVLTERQLADLELLSTGALSPLRGFMNQGDYLSVRDDMHLENGAAWTIPITLAVDAGVRCEEGTRLALRDSRRSLRAILDVEQVYAYSKSAEATAVYGTGDAAHPGVAALYAQSDVLIGGSITAIRQDSRGEFALTPAETRAEFTRRGWHSIVGFQTRNPVHRAHEYIQKCALELVDGLLLHPLVGETKRDDIPAHTRMKCYQALLEHYYPKDRVLLSTFPASMRYAGPREAIFHAIVRKNYGCTHFIVGRDHAGVANFYGPYDAQRLFDAFSPAELGIIPLKFENSFYCRTCAGMASKKTCPHDSANHVALSGTSVREMLSAGQLPPPEFSRPEVARLLAAQN